MLVPEDLCDAAYGRCSRLATDGSWLEAVVGMTVAIAALLGAFASYRWGHHVGRLVTHPKTRTIAVVAGAGHHLIVAAVAESLHARRPGAFR